MRGKNILISVIAALMAATIGNDITYASEPLPPLPIIFSGSVTQDGKPVPDGSILVAKLGPNYTTEPITISNGRYVALTVGPDPDEAYSLIGTPITFHLGLVQAAESDNYRILGSFQFKPAFNLTFPPAPTPTPTPTPEPTATPEATPTPVIAHPSAYSGLIIIAGGTIPEDALLTARIGDYESIPAIIQDGGYLNLILDPSETSFFGMSVTFFLNGVKSRTTDTYESGKFLKDFDLVFIDMPTATPIPPTATPIPTAVPAVVEPTATAVPTAIPVVLPTSAPIPTAVPAVVEPTATAVPTAIPVLPTAAPIPTAVPAVVEPTAAAVLTAIAVPPTAAPIVTTVVPTTPPEPTQEASGGCNSTGGPTDPMTGLGNILLLAAPLGLIGIARRYRRHS